MERNPRLKERVLRRLSFLFLSRIVFLSREEKKWKEEKEKKLRAFRYDGSKRFDRESRERERDSGGTRGKNIRNIKDVEKV